MMGLHGFKVEKEIPSFNNCMRGLVVLRISYSEEGSLMRA